MTTPQQNPAQQNALARAMLLATGLAFTKRLPALNTQNATLGQTVRIPLDRTGIVTGVMLNFTAPVDVTAAATVSPFGPYNLVSNIEYVDFAGVKHVQTTGFQLHLINSIKGHRFLNNAQKMSGYIPAETGIDTDILNVPTGVGNANMQFSLYVPLAYDAASDLRGAVLAQTDRGEHYINVTFCNALVAADTLAAPYSAGTVALQAGAQIAVDAYQNYLMPQTGVSAATLPMIDLSTIYELSGNLFDSSNLVAGASKYVNWPNNRAVLSAHHIFDNGNTGTLNGADINQLTLLVNGNTNVREMSPRYLRNIMRYAMGADFPSGVYYIGARNQPITTQLYGNVQTKLDLATVNAGAYLINGYESFYLSGTPLPGVIQA